MVCILRYDTSCSLFFFNDTATTEIYTLSLHDALPISAMGRAGAYVLMGLPFVLAAAITLINPGYMDPLYHSSSGHKLIYLGLDRKSTRLNSSHANISYAVFCLKKKNKITKYTAEETAT